MTQSVKLSVWYLKWASSGAYIHHRALRSQTRSLYVPRNSAASAHSSKSTRRVATLRASPFAWVRAWCAYSNLTDRLVVWLIGLSGSVTDQSSRGVSATFLRGYQ